MTDEGEIRLAKLKNHGYLSHVHQDLLDTIMASFLPEEREEVTAALNALTGDKRLPKHLVIRDVSHLPCTAGQWGRGFPEPQKQDLKPPVAPAAAHSPVMVKRTRATSSKKSKPKG